MNMKIQREKVAFFTSFVFRRLCRLLDSPAFIMAHCSSDSSYDTFSIQSMFRMNTVRAEMKNYKYNKEIDKIAQHE